MEKETGIFFYLMDIGDHQGYVNFRLHKIIKDGIEGYESFRSYKPFEEEFSRQEINYFLSYFYGYLIGYFHAVKEIIPVQPFLNRIDSNLIFYGYQNGDYFEKSYNTTEAYEEEIQAFEDKHGTISKSRKVDILLQTIMSEQV